MAMSGRKVSRKDELDRKGGNGMKRLLVALVLVTLVSGVCGAVPYPYGLYDLETEGDLSELHDEVVKSHTVSVQTEGGDFYPWHEMSSAKIETQMTVDAMLNRDAYIQFWTPEEKKGKAKEMYAELLDDNLTFLTMLFADFSLLDGAKYLGLSPDIHRAVLEVDGTVYYPSEMETISATDRMGLSYVRFPRYDDHGSQVITEDSRVARLWVISRTSRIFFEFVFEAGE